MNSVEPYKSVCSVSQMNIGAEQFLDFAWIQNKYTTVPRLISSLLLLLPDNSFTAGEFISQEAQYGSFLCRCVGLEGLGLQTECQRS